MEVTLPEDLTKQVQQELASGRYRNADDLIEQAVRSFLEERDRGERRLAALRRIGQAVDQAGLYERVFLPGQLMTGMPLVVLDACVLANFSLCDILLRLAELPRLFEAKWSEEIIRETIRTLESKLGWPNSLTTYLESELRTHFSEAWITGYDHLVQRMTNDEKDHHVLAVAVQGEAPIIVTFHRATAGLTQQQLAQRMATTQSVIARLESGRTRPSTQTLERLAAATGTRLKISFEPVSAH